MEYSVLTNRARTYYNDDLKIIIINTIILNIKKNSPLESKNKVVTIISLYYDTLKSYTMYSATLIIYYVQNNSPLITYNVSGNTQLGRLRIVK